MIRTSLLYLGAKNRTGSKELARYQFKCDGCGRWDYNDVVPPGWEERVRTLVGGAQLLQHLCEICKVRFE